MEVWTTSGLDRAYFLCGSLSPGIVKEGSVDYIRTGPSLLPVWIPISRYSKGWKCGPHPDWTELTSCMGHYLKVKYRMEVWTTSGLDRAYSLCGPLSQGTVEDGKFKSCSGLSYIFFGPPFKKVKYIPTRGWVFFSIICIKMFLLIIITF